MDLSRAYDKMVKKTYGRGFHAAWFPTTPLELGTYGRVESGRLIPIGNISDLGIEFEMVRAAEPSPLNINTSTNVSVEPHLTVETNPALPNMPAATASITIKFSAKGAFVLAADQVFDERIKHIGSLGPKLVELRSTGKWGSSYRIVSAISRMPYMSLIISNSTSSSVDVQLNGTLTPAIKEIGKVGIGVVTKAEHSSVLQLLSIPNATPIFEMHRLRPRWFVDDRIGIAGTRVPDAPESEEWDLVRDEDQDDSDAHLESPTM